MNWFFLIDKHINISSFDVIRKLRKTLNCKKMWHSWTLDPLASGGLLVAVWDYTKLIPFLEKETKEYEFVVNLDWETDSFDLWTEINFISKERQDFYKKTLMKENIEKILKENFLWKIKQIPPKYSALKINWERAYNLVRAWEEVEMKSREVEIFDINILSFYYPKLRLKAKVSAWTYIRSIAYDLGRIIWSSWYVSFLRRTKIWSLDISLAQELENITKDNYLNIKDIFNEKNFLTLDKNILKRIDNWLQTKIVLPLEKDKNYFVEKEWIISNVIFYDWQSLTPIRKI